MIFTKSKTTKEALFYIGQTIENAWGRETLALQIKSQLFERQGKAVTNFKTTLPAPLSDLAQQTLKDPCNFDFVAIVRRDERKGFGRTNSSHRFPNFCSNWVKVSPTSGGSIISKSRRTIIIWICFFITSN